MARDKRSDRMGLRVKPVFVSLLMLAAVGANGQVRLPPLTTADKSACASLSDPPRVPECKACFGEIMAGCRDYTTQAEQEICRQAALSFFSTCVKAALLHNDVAIPLVSLHIDASDNLDARIPYYMLFEVDVPTELENVSVLLGGVQDIGYCLQDVTVQSSISTEDGLIFSIMLDLADVQFTVGSTVDLIVAVNDSLTSNPIAIDINAVTLEDSFDLNGDGAFDSRDYLAALIQYGNGELDTDTFYGILGEYYRR